MITQRHNPAYRHACILFYRLRRDFPSRRPDSRESILPYAKHFRAFLAEAKSTTSCCAARCISLRSIYSGKSPFLHPSG